MFDRFTDEAKRAMSLARKASQSWDHEYIGTEHILLGVVEEDNAACEVLRSVGVDPSEVTATVGGVLKRGSRTVTMGQLPFTPRAKKVLELSVEAASSLSHRWLGVQHLLIGLLRECEGIGAVVLVKLGASTESVTAELARRWPGEEIEHSWAVASEGLQATLANALETAVRMGDPEVEVAHVLLCSLDDEQSFWSRVCAVLDVEPSQVREAIHLAVRGND